MALDHAVAAVGTVRRPLYVSRTPFDDRRIGAAAVYCSDGRFGEQMDEFLHESLGLPRYDRVAVPGGAACLAGHLAAFAERAAVERQLRFLIEGHGLQRVVLIAHPGCAFYKDIWLGNRTLAQQQVYDLAKAAEHIRGWRPAVDVDTYIAANLNGRVTFNRSDG